MLDVLLGAETVRLLAVPNNPIFLTGTAGLGIAILSNSSEPTAYVKQLMLIKKNYEYYYTI